MVCWRILATPEKFIPLVTERKTRNRSGSTEMKVGGGERKIIAENDGKKEEELVFSCPDIIFNFSRLSRA